MNSNYLKRKPESLSVYYNFLSTVAWDDLSNAVVYPFIDELELLAYETSTFVCTLKRDDESIAARMYQNYQKFYNNLISSKHASKFENNPYIAELVDIWSEYEESEYGDDEITTMREIYTENEIENILNDQTNPIIQKLTQYFGQSSSASERTRKYDTEDPNKASENNDGDFIEY